MENEKNETAMRAFLTFILAAPGAAAAGCLVTSFLFTSTAVAQGEHLGPFQEYSTPCPGCPLCGMSRAFAAMSHGSVAEAVDLNAGVVLAWPLSWAMVALSIYAVVRTLSDPPRFFSPAKVNPDVQRSQ